MSFADALTQCVSGAQISLDNNFRWYIIFSEEDGFVRYAPNGALEESGCTFDVDCREYTPLNHVWYVR